MAVFHRLGLAQPRRRSDRRHRNHAGRDRTPPGRGMPARERGALSPAKPDRFADPAQQRPPVPPCPRSGNGTLRPLPPPALPADCRCGRFQAGQRHLGSCRGQPRAADPGRGHPVLPAPDRQCLPLWRRGVRRPDAGDRCAGRRPVRRAPARLLRRKFAGAFRWHRAQCQHQHRGHRLLPWRRRAQPVLPRRRRHVPGQAPGQEPRRRSRTAERPVVATPTRLGRGRFPELPERRRQGENGADRGGACHARLRLLTAKVYPMLTALIAVFIVAYAAIALEHPLKINKSASALVGAGLLWTIYALATGDHHLVSEQLGESLMGTAQIVFFLMGAMTIVEVVDAHNGFEVITQRIRTTSLSSLMWLGGFVTFFLSATLANLTTIIVMISLMRKLLAKHEDRLFFAGIIVIAANSGGAWSPIGDVTTTMLWIGGQITALAIIKSVFLPALVSLIVPLAITAYVLRGKLVESPAVDDGDHGIKTTEFERNLMFYLVIGILVAVPAFKTITHLPPFMGLLFGLGILWLVGDIVHRHKEDEYKQHLTLAHALSKID